MVFVALFIDSVGSGLWLPFSLIFFTRAQELPMVACGAALSTASLLALVVGQLGGGLVDRYGPGRLVLLSNIVRVGTFALYPLVQTIPELGVLAFVTASASRLYWTASTPFVSTLVRGRAVDQFLATNNMLRIGGVGLGAAAAGFFADSVAGLHAIAWANAASFGVAALLLVIGVRRFGRPAAPAPAETDEPAAGPRTSVWRDTAYLQLCLCLAVFILVQSSFVVVLPLVIVDFWHGPEWLAGGSIVVGNVVLFLAQRPAVMLAARSSRSRMLLRYSIPCYLAALLLLTAADLFDGVPLIVVVLSGVIVGAIGEGISNPLMLAAANEVAPEGMKGRYSAVYQTTFGLADTMGPLLFTMLLGLGSRVLWLSLAALMVVLVPLLASVRHRLPPSVLSS